mgnify:CR=1 FL=1|tara:strand:+ start:501 stop:641 length:141 start_codon:yes stop_codon:yes gene_type:complete
MSNKLDLEVRFDIIDIVATKDTSQIEHIENAFITFGLFVFNNLSIL